MDRWEASRTEQGRSSEGRPGADDPHGDEADAPGAESPGPSESPDPFAGPVTEGVRIAAVEAAVAAGLAPSTTRAVGAGRRAEQPATADPSAYQLPDWSDPPTGQVPRVLLDEGAPDAGPGAGQQTRRPTWREGSGSWEDLDLTFLVEAGTPAGMAGAGESDEGEGDPFGFSFATFDPHPAIPEAGSAAPRDPEPAGGELTVEDAAWSELISRPGAAASDAPAASSHRRHARGQPKSARARDGRAGRKRRERRAARALEDPADAPSRAEAEAADHLAADHLVVAAPDGWGAAPEAVTGVRRSPVLAVTTGVAAGGVALVCFFAGPLATLVLVATIVAVAAGELLGALRRARFRPASPVALAAAPALMIATYLRGVSALPLLLAIAVALSFCWFLVQRTRRAPAADLAVSLLVVCWVGLLGSFAGALLAPGSFTRRHGLAVLVGAVVLAVANDVGAYASGSRLGRHRLAPSVSPGKTWEGFAGGTVLTVVLAVLVAARLHPLDLKKALVLGAIVCLLAPLGDLGESLLKRDLGLKDMGGLLPAHGGVLDRVDSLLFVLPAAYYVAIGFHLR